MGCMHRCSLSGVGTYVYQGTKIYFQYPQTNAWMDAGEYVSNLTIKFGYMMLPYLHKYSDRHNRANNADQGQAVHEGVV